MNVQNILVMPLFSSYNLNVIYLLNIVEFISSLKLQSQWLKGLGFWRTSRELKLNNETKIKVQGEIFKKKQKAFSRTTYISKVSIHQTFPILEFLGVQGISGILSDTIEQCSHVILKLKRKKKKTT